MPDRALVPGDEKIELRLMRPDDVEPLLGIARAQGRNVHPSEYERFLELEGAHGHVILRDGALEGGVTAMRYFEHGFLGPLIVTGEDAIGFSLLLAGAALENLQKAGVGRVDAEASAQDESILRGLGFAPARATLILEREPQAARLRGRGTRAMTSADLLDVGVLDASAVGYGRKEYLQRLMLDYPAGARVLGDDEHTRGYALARRARRGYHLGPLVTREGDIDAADALLDDTLESVAGWPVVALAPEGSALAGALAREGFSEVGRLQRLRAGHLPARAEWDEPPATEWLVGSRLTG